MVSSKALACQAYVVTLIACARWSEDLKRDLTSQFPFVKQIPGFADSLPRSLSPPHYVKVFPKKFAPDAFIWITRLNLWKSPAAHTRTEAQTAQTAQFGHPLRILARLYPRQCL